jgi:hypothetical protein
MGQYATGALVDDLQTADHAGDVPSGAAVVGEPHSIDGEGRPVVGDQYPVAAPRLQGVGRDGVSIRPAAGHVDADDVVAGASLERIDVGIGEHVVRGRDHRSEIVGGVAEGGERYELWHGPSVVHSAVGDFSAPVSDTGPKHVSNGHAEG